ncbi:hypothetical protein [Klebsiella aerogenes]|uniref:hypothetical protein n=1 Tax=Klebsiella aerogenes TaxID=548 RepID=UPI000DA248F6|nr:hypothetical protein [Klebsiella aerogenes]HCB2859842.1 hypothetical protein [Klebsiella aerogenes]HCB2864845.1 hypothetical protein [Klebsiella aerogenes]HCB2880483.1 hypothetical protein [Klebsiella aerogenes]HCB3345908.1 hypothetical protein [Klebsiella aerogenes]HCM1811910.1 hypothetical protein [Klebsiella aerogenes]
MSDTEGEYGMKQKREVVRWLLVSVAYLVAACWIFIGSLDFGELYLAMGWEDFDHQIDCKVMAVLGVFMVMTPIYCVWLEWWVMQRFGRLRFLCRRYGVSIATAAAASVLYWLRSHADIEYPYHSESIFADTGIVVSALILALCTIQAGRECRDGVR